MIVKYDPEKTGIAKFINWWPSGKLKGISSEVKDFFNKISQFSTEAEKVTFSDSFSFSENTEALKTYVKEVDAASWSLENYKEWAKQAGIQTSSFTKLVGGAKKILTSFATSFISGLIFAALTKGAQMLYQFVDENYLHKLEHLKDLANDAAQAYSSEKSKAEQLNSELDSMNQQIDQLQAKGKLNFIEKEQLEDLQNTTKELREQVALEEKKVAASKQDYLDKKRDALNEEFDLSVTKATINSSDLYPSDLLEYMSDDNIFNIIAVYQELLRRQKEEGEI